jgi:hypothetical protein
MNTPDRRQLGRDWSAHRETLVRLGNSVLLRSGSHSLPQVLAGNRLDQAA